MSRNQRKKARRAIEADAAMQDERYMTSMFAGREVISKSRARTAHKTARRAIADHEKFGGVLHFLPALHHDSAVLIKGRTWVKRKRGRFTPDTLKDFVKLS